MGRSWNTRLSKSAPPPTKKKTNRNVAVKRRTAQQLPLQPISLTTLNTCTSANKRRCHTRFYGYGRHTSIAGGHRQSRPAKSAHARGGPADSSQKSAHTQLRIIATSHEQHIHSSSGRERAERNRETQITRIMRIECFLNANSETTKKHIKTAMCKNEVILMGRVSVYFNDRDDYVFTIIGLMNREFWGEHEFSSLFGLLRLGY